MEIKIVELFSHIPVLPESLYLHYPVCKHHCSYCDFNVFPAQKLGEHFSSGWLQALKKHLQHFLNKSRPEIRPLKTLYFGGGTPSLLKPEEVAAVVQIFSAAFGLNSDIEITLEANPENLDRDYLLRLRDLGVNRLSLGVQTTIPNQLRRLERLATAKKIFESVENVAEIFSNFSLDFMIGIPDQTPSTLLSDLQFIESIRPPHLSIYILTLSDDHRWKTKPSMSKLLMPSETVAETYEKICEFLKSLGYGHYEVSNFARPGFESRHNRNYWDASSQYLAFGPGAHGYLQNEKGQRIRYEMLRSPEAWQSSASGVDWCEVLSAEQQNLERLYLNLRTRVPIPLANLNSAPIPEFARSGWCEVSDSHVHLTEKGWLLMESLASKLL